MRPEETGLNRIILDQQMETGLKRITYLNHTLSKTVTQTVRAPVVRTRPSEHHPVLTKQKREEIKNISIIYLFIILNILARVRITKIGYRSILPSSDRGF